MDSLEDLQPKAIWHYFNEICKVPRPSKREGQMVAYVKNFAETHHLSYEADEVGNVLVRKPATKGRENSPSLLFQSHVDMVAEKNNDVEHDFDKDPIQPYIDGDWVKAKGTTLGADDGMGVAAQLAILAADDIEHGPIECLFTVDEETGLTGANALKPGIIKSKLLVNLDSEDDGDFCIGCAGGMDTKAYFTYLPQAAPVGPYYFKVEVKGLQGGHSGEDINKNRGNAVQLLARYLYKLSCVTEELLLGEIKGGNLHNAIARESYALAGVAKADRDKVATLAVQLLDELKGEYPNEPDLTLIITDAEKPVNLIDEQTAKNLIAALLACPHGVQGMSADIEGLVETSTNLASVKMLADKNQILVGTSQRSSVASRKDEIKLKVEAVFKLAGAEVTHGDGYPGWKPNMNSYIKDVLVASYSELFGQQPLVRAIHAGLECGLFLEKYPDLDMISVGPTIIGNHSPAERVQISTVAKFWEMLIDVMKRVK